MFDVNKFQLVFKESLITTVDEKLIQHGIQKGGNPNYGNIVISVGGAGCYPEDTEFFTGSGWKKISEYEDGDNVLQYDVETGLATLTDKVDFICLPKDKFYRIKNKRVDFVTSLYHRHLLRNHKNKKIITKTTDEILKDNKFKTKGTRASLLTCFRYGGYGINLSDDEIRLRVAIYADGYIKIRHKKTPNLFTIRARFTKDRKIIRFRNLLNLNGLVYREYQEGKYTVFEFHYNSDEKEYNDYWYNATNRQFSIIVDECIFWDGSKLPKSAKFFSTSKKSADFVQFAASACGISVTRYIDERPNRTTCYTLRFNNSNGLGIQKNNRTNNTTNVTDCTNEFGEKMYCFSVPKDAFIVRQNDQIFVSRNSGKGWVLKNFIDTSKFSVFDVDELKKLVLKVTELKNTFPEMKYIDLKNPSDVSKLHDFVKKRGIKDAYLNKFFGNKNPEYLPNLYFDITGKTRKDIEEIVERAIEVGYKSQNINVVYVLNDLEVQQKNNKSRDRTVPRDIVLNTTTGAAKTFLDIVQNPIDDLGGRIDVVLNLAHLTKIVKSPSGGSYVKDFEYFNIKQPGKPFDRKRFNEKNIKELISKLVLQNIDVSKK